MRKKDTLGFGILAILTIDGAYTAITFDKV